MRLGVTAAVLAGVAVLVAYVTAPKKNPDGSFSPSPLMMVASKSGQVTAYDGEPFSAAAAKKSGKKVLVVMADRARFTMTNNKDFLTGNHPVEMYLPMLHLAGLGFDFDVATESGKPAALEEWALPLGDENVMGMHAETKSRRENPLKLSEVKGIEEYSAIFVPGGHGAMLGLPESRDLGRLLAAAHARQLTTITLCHGPAGLLAAGDTYKGYKIAAFPDSLDKITPYLGYLPGHLPFYFGEMLRSQGVEIVNGLADAPGQTNVDRELITGDSPDAANKVGHLAVEALRKQQ